MFLGSYMHQSDGVTTMDGRSSWITLAIVIVIVFGRILMRVIVVVVGGHAQPPQCRNFSPIGDPSNDLLTGSRYPISTLFATKPIGLFGFHMTELDSWTASDGCVCFVFCFKRKEMDESDGWPTTKKRQICDQMEKGKKVKWEQERIEMSNDMERYNIHIYSCILT